MCAYVVPLVTSCDLYSHYQYTLQFHVNTGPWLHPQFHVLPTNACRRWIFYYVHVHAYTWLQSEHKQLPVTFYVYIHVYTCRCQPCVACVDAALLLFTHLIQELKYRGIDVLKILLTVLLFSLAKVKSYVTQNKVQETKIRDTLGICQKKLQQWVIKEHIIGGSFFGGTRKGDAELQVHDTIFVHITFERVYQRVSRLSM